MNTMLNDLWTTIQANQEGIIVVLGAFLTAYVQKKVKGTSLNILSDLPIKLLSIFGIDVSKAPEMKEKLINDLKANNKANIIKMRETLLNTEIKLASKVLSREQKEKLLQLAKDTMNDLRELGHIETITIPEELQVNVETSK